MAATVNFHMYLFQSKSIINLERFLCNSFHSCCISRSNRSLEKHIPNRVFSGIQPTGALHLGNFFGAVSQWIQLQNSQVQCFYSVVDLHSITLPQDPTILRTNVVTMAASLIACGVDPSKCVLFQQSKVPEHAELCWILGCMLSINRLARLPQFKEKSATRKEIPLGIYVYPVLQAADILLYKADSIPVGEDQVQHVQLAKELADKFNKRFGHILVHPHALIYDSISGRIQSLRNPEKKMSKSDADYRGRIDLCDSPDVIREKIKKAVTDCNSAVTYDPEKRPGVSNLVALHSLASGCSPQEICSASVGLETAEYKTRVADALVEFLAPIQCNMKRLLNDPAHVVRILDKGAEQARKVASQTLQSVKEAIGLT